MRIDQDDAALVRAPPRGRRTAGARQHQVVDEPQHERRFAAARLGDRQQMAAQQARAAARQGRCGPGARSSQSGSPRRSVLTATVAGNGSAGRAVVRSTNGTSSAACGRCHRPASSREFSKHGRPSGARTRRSGIGARIGRCTKLLPAASANGRYAAARRSRRARTRPAPRGSAL